MNIHDKMAGLLAAQEALTTSAGLCEHVRPYSAQSNLSEIDKLIMATAQELANISSEDGPLSEVDDDSDD